LNKKKQNDPTQFIKRFSCLNQSSDRRTNDRSNGMNECIRVTTGLSSAHTEPSSAHDTNNSTQQQSHIGLI